MQAPFVVPEGYFGTLADSLKAGTIASFQNDLRPAGFPTTLPLTVPEGYLTMLPDTMLEAAKKQSTPSKHAWRSINFHPQWRHIIRFAAAAVLVLGVSVGSYRYLHVAGPEKIAVQQLSKLDDDAIENYVELHVDDFDVESLEATIPPRTDIHPELLRINTVEIQDYLEDADEII